MAKEVIMTPIALSDFRNVVNYLTYKWGITATNSFIDRFEKVTVLLSENAGIYPFFDKAKQLQKCVITKHNILYFIETEAVVKILFVFDTRQDPKKLSSLI